MAKKLSRINFILVTLFVVIGLVLTFCQFKLPFSTNNYAGFANAITTNSDIGSSQVAVYELSPVSTEVTSLTEQEKKDAVSFVRFALTSFTSDNNAVCLQGESSLRVEIPETTTSESVLNSLSERVEIIIRGSETDQTTEYDVNSDGFKTVSWSYQQSSTSEYTLGVQIEFNESGKADFERLTEYVGSTSAKTLYFYSADGTQIGTQANVTRKIITGVVFVPNSQLKTQSEAESYAINVQMGALDTKLKLVENSVSSANLGHNALTYLVVGVSVAYILTLVFMALRYKDLGLLSILASAINFVIYMFLLQSLPIVCLSIAGIIGSALGMALTIFGNVVVFERIKNEYTKGKKIHLAVKSGFKKSILNVVDLSCVSLLIALVMYFAGTELIKAFAIPLFIGGLLTMFSSLLVTKMFCKWYLILNSTNAKHMGLKKVKEAGDNE